MENKSGEVEILKISNLPAKFKMYKMVVGLNLPPS